MKKILALVVVASWFISCKSVKNNSTQVSNTNERSVSDIILGYKKNEVDFKTLKIKANANYEDAQNKQSVDVDIRIKKGEIIWINIKILGIPLAKAYISPSKVSYFEKPNKTYFDGNFEMLSQWLGTDLDYTKVENLLLGRAIETLTKEDFIVSIVNQMYALRAKKETTVQKIIYIDPIQYLVKKEVVKQENKELSIDYPAFSLQNKMYLPQEIKIEAKQKQTTKIALEYKTFTFDEDLKFPYEVPSGYEEVKVN